MKNTKKHKKYDLKRSNRDIKMVDESLEILGVSIFGTHKQEVLRKIWLQRKEILHIATVNSEYIMEARNNPKFKEVLTQCLTIADGWGVVWANKILDSGRQMLVERISGVGLAEEIVRHAAEKNEKIFLLGARVGVAERAAANMSKKYPTLQISWYEGAKTVKVEKNEEASMTIAKINAYEPDYLLVAYGSPYQDLWIEENRPYLRVRVTMGIGGTFDEWAGVTAKCPWWIDRLGFKWAWRLVHEPWRWRRILRVLEFGLLVLYHKLID
ncbi:MAG: WecB/TagA/CpsF family glycosyltransferase [bacterium]